MATAGPAKSSPRGGERYKMVLIGETGSGKTSLIELLLNYAKQFGTANFDLLNVSSFVKSSGSASTEKKAWVSDTTYSKKYEAVFGDFMLEIIDTPGFADTRGENQKKENVANIINKVKEELYVNCICLVINGTRVRLTTVMREVLDEITSILPPDVLRNIIIVFTKTRDKLSLKFDLGVLEEEFQLSVPKNFIFTVDNPYTRLQSVGDGELDEETSEILADDFVKAHRMLEKMFAVTKRLKPALTLKFGEFHEATQDIDTSLAKLNTSHENKAKVEHLLARVDLDKVSKIEYEQTSVETGDSWHIVCTKPGCNSNCHINCDCSWFTLLFPGLCRKVSGLSLDPGVLLDRGWCRTCEHSYRYHRKVNYYYDTIKREILVPDHEKKKCLQNELSSYEKEVKDETRSLELKLKKFQSLGSNGFFSEKAKKHIYYLMDAIEEMPGTEWKPNIIRMLSAYLTVLEDPLTAKDEDTKFRWACGILGINPNNVTKAEISKLFRQQAQRFHPDSSKDDSTSGWFKQLNHAKEFVSKKLFS